MHCPFSGNGQEIWALCGVNSMLYLIRCCFCKATVQRQRLAHRPHWSLSSQATSKRGFSNAWDLARSIFQSAGRPSTTTPPPSPCALDTAHVPTATRSHSKETPNAAPRQYMEYYAEAALHVEHSSRVHAAVPYCSVTALGSTAAQQSTGQTKLHMHVVAITV